MVKLCCTKPPMIYMCFVLWITIILNLYFVWKSVWIKKCLVNEHIGQKSSKVVRLLDTSEHTILSRIRYPERDAARIHGSSFNPLKKKIVIGIPSLYRPWTNEKYLNSTLHGLLQSLDSDELDSVGIVIFLNDKSKDFRLKRARIIYSQFKDLIDSGHAQIIHPPKNIYPFLNYSQILRTFRNTPGQVEWRSKICLDFSFLMSYCSESGAKYFIHMEDDVSPVPGFINKTQEFIKSQTSTWTSLQLSEFMSIGRLYRVSELKNIVDFILISYTKMPVDWLMEEYDRIQLADGYKVHKIKTPLFTHGGEISSKGVFVRKEQMAVNKKWDQYKSKNPPNATLLTNMRQYQYFSLNDSYFPNSLFFWCIPFPGGIVDLIFDKPLSLSSVSIVSGMEESDGRENGTDSLMDAWLKASSKLIQMYPRNGYADCAEFVNLVHINRPTSKITYRGFDDSFPGARVQCLRLEMGEGQNPYKSWLVIKLFRIITQG